jgi:predicted RNA-binding Zn ribbon-like protein
MHYNLSKPASRLLAGSTLVLVDAPITMSTSGPQQSKNNPKHPLTLQAEPDPGLAAQAEPYVFDLDGGRACLDFANTHGSSGEHLNSYLDLVAFASQSELITAADGGWLQAQARRDPAGARAVLARATRLRDAMQSIFSSVAAGQVPPSVALGVLNVELAASLGHARVQPADAKGEFVWGWRDRALDLPLWPICRSAADVLVSDNERRLVRECGAGDCAWLFVDTTRNRSRQWCSMRSCGNREKARRHYQRQRASRDARVGD